jgi:hypothetical protein
MKKVTKDPHPDPDPRPHPDPLVRGTDPRIRIRIRVHTKMSRIRNNDLKDPNLTAPSLDMVPPLPPFPSASIGKLRPAGTGIGYTGERKVRAG